MSDTKLDMSLLVACKKGDEESWRQLFRSLYPIARWVSKHILRDSPEQVWEEVAQETMIVLAREIRTISDMEHAGRFVRIIARNKSIDFIRKSRVKLEEIPDDYPAHVHEELEDSVIMRLRCAVQEIGEPCRTIIRRRFYDDLSHKDIAMRLGVAVNQVGVRIQRCLKTLKMLLSSSNVTAEDLP